MDNKSLTAGLGQETEGSDRDMCSLEATELLPMMMLVVMVHKVYIIPELERKLRNFHAYLTSLKSGNANKVVRNSGDSQGLGA